MIPSIKLKSGNQIPRLGLGTWMIGGAMTKDPLNDDKGQINAIQYGINRGLTFIRTAQNYAAGHCEEIIGEAINNLDRAKLYLMVSIFENNASGEEEILVELAKSLKRLKTDYVDMLIVGGINPAISLKKVGLGLIGAKKRGLARDLGVGNYRLRELTYLNELMEGQLNYNEMQYNLIVREPELTKNLEYQLQHNIIFGAYRPLQLGQLAKPGIKLLDELAIKYDKTQSQITLKWLLMHDNLVTFPKATNKSHIDELSDLFSWDLSVADIDNLRSNFPIQMRVGDCISPVTNFTK